MSLFILALGLGLTGCHSAFIAATLSNRSGQPVSLVEVDYPSASFGVDALQAGKTYQYRFKVLGSGSTSVSWTDAANHQHKSTGPNLREGDDGNLVIIFQPGNTATWSLRLTNRSAS